MLVLERKTDQRLILDLSDYGIKEPIVVLVTKVRGERVWLGVEANRRVLILREELLERSAGEPGRD